MSSDRVLPPPYSLGQALDRLPLHARRKYDDIKALLADSEVLQRSQLERIRVKEERLAALLRRRSYAAVSGGDGAEVKRLDGELAGIRVDLDGLERERSKRNSVRANTEQICSRLDIFIGELFSGAGDVTMPPWLATVPGPHEGESISDAIPRVRREISAARTDLLRVRSAPPPKDEIMIGIIESIDRLAMEGRPLVTSDSGRVELIWPDVMQYAVPGSALSAPSGSASKLLCALFPTELKKLLLAGVKDVPGGIPSADRPRLIREAEQHIFALEVSEEKLVCQALEAGLECHRRIDASPFAILGLFEEAVPAAEAAE